MYGLIIYHKTESIKSSLITALQIRNYHLPATKITEKSDLLPLEISIKYQGCSNR